MTPERADGKTQSAGAFAAQLFDKGTPHPVALLVINDFGPVLFDGPLLVFQRFTGTDIDTFCTILRTPADSNRLAICKDFINQNG